MSNKKKKLVGALTVEEIQTDIVTQVCVILNFYSKPVVRNGLI